LWQLQAIRKAGHSTLKQMETASHNWKQFKSIDFPMVIWNGVHAASAQFNLDVN
jgi:hypothetical protein